MRIWRDDPDHSIFTVYLDGVEVRASGADEVEGWVIVDGIKLFGKVRITVEEEPCLTCRR